jgi:hypothetical protein
VQKILLDRAIESYNRLHDSSDQGGGSGKNRFVRGTWQKSRAFSPADDRQVEFVVAFVLPAGFGCDRPRSRLQERLFQESRPRIPASRFSQVTRTARDRVRGLDLRRCLVFERNLPTVARGFPPHFLFEQQVSRGAADNDCCGCRGNWWSIESRGTLS